MKETYTQKELEKVAIKMLDILDSGERATVVGLVGDLGAGKTTLAGEVARALGVRSSVVSPTFVIMKRYELVGQKWDTLIHIDAYRLDDSKELTVLGWEELITTPRTLIIIEWPTKVADILPPDTQYFSIEHVDEDTRTIMRYTA